VLLENGECEVPIKITRPNTIRLFLWSAIKNAVYASKPRALQDLRRETETACASVPLATIQKVCQSGARHCQQYFAAGDEHFEDL
jgi:hypothetical protein